MIFYDYYRDKKVFITGHTGFKGSWLAKWLTLLGASVTGYSLYVPSEPSLFEELELENQIEHFIGDVSELEKLKLAIEKSKPDIIFHLAAQPIVRKSYEDPIITYRSNLIGTINLLEILRDSPNIQSAVFITSDKCYENVEQHKGYTETDRLGGKDPYSSSKACAEIAISSYFRSYFIDSALPKIAIGRAGNVIGGGDWAKDRIIPDCIKAWSKDIECTLRKP